jgi:Mn-dependent transcriptional regulator
MMGISPREIDYLSAIKRLNDGGKPAKLSALAKEIEVSPASAFEELRHLERKGLIRKQDNDIFITEEGRKSLIRAKRAHRVIESLLVKTGLDPSSACNYSKKFELDVPEEIIEKLYEFLGRPEKCPHGEEIP